MSRSVKRPATDNVEDQSPRSTPSEDRSSSPLSTSRKRRRLSDDSLVDEDEEDNQREQTPPSEYEFEADEEDEVAATQAIRQKRALQGENEPAECGILVNVELFNFMCHEHMIYELGPLINFICGKNGSGKSAILTAIVICLGGKASSTNRGQSLKSFIREGQDQARIICRLKNEGETAYLPEDYGGMIEIERYFSKHGASGFKIKNERGRTISTKKMDLEEICDHFGLQIDNPLNVLSQDMARQFLADSNASEKYKFFIKGVQLEQLDQDYRLIEEQLEHIEANVEKKRPDIDVLERKMQKAKARDDAMRMKDQVRERIRGLRRQIAWVQVQDQESFRDKLVNDIAEADQKIQDAEGYVEELDQIFQESNAANEEAKQTFDHMQEALQAAQDENKERMAKRDEAKNEVTDAMAELRTIRTALTGCDISIQKAQENIEREQHRIAEIQGGGAAERIRSLAEAEGDLALAIEAHDKGKKDVADLHAEEQKSKQVLEAIDGVRQERQSEVEKAKNALKQIENSSDKLENVFGHAMPALLKCIQKEAGRFMENPIGPLGTHVRLIKPEWSSLLEKSFGGSLNGFIVTSKQDSDVLAGLMRQVKCQVPIMIVNHVPLQNVKDHEPDAKFDTILRILEIDHDLVRKQLILQNGIEQTILIRDLKEASRTMFDGGKLKNVKRCFCINQYNKRSGHILSYTKTGEPSQDPIYEFAGRARMKTDNQAQVQMRRDALQESRDRLHAAENEYYEARNAKVKAEQIATKASKRFRTELLLEKQRCEDEVARLKDAIENDHLDEGNLRAFQDNLVSAQKEKALNEGSYKDAVLSCDEKKAVLSSAQQEVQNWGDKVKEADRNQAKAQKAANRADVQRTHDLREKNAAIARVGDAKNDRETIDRKRIEQEQKLEDYIAQALAISERVNVPENKNHEMLMEEHDALRKDLDRFRAQMGGTEDEIAKAYESARNAFKKARRDLENLETIANRLKGSLKERRDRWKIFRSLISVRAKAQFTYLLSERSFRGKLITDHKQKLLELRVEPDITKRDGQGRNARTLSGGEKSFSQICLLLSIWEAMGSPIRCLDEFDVFMDPVNRNLSVNLLIEAARQSVGRQFILISPGTKNDIQRAPDIRAKEIAAPERGQRTLAFATKAR